MNPKLLIVDFFDERRKKLVGVLYNSYSVVAVNRADFVDAKYVFAIVHENNWSAADGWGKFKRTLEKNGIPYVTTSTAGKEQVLYLKRGDEYSEIQWCEAIKKFTENKIDTKGFLKLMYLKYVRELIEELATVGVMESNSPHLVDVVRNRIAWIDEKKKENEWFELIKEQAGNSGLVESLLELLQFIATGTSNKTKEFRDLLTDLSKKLL